LIVTYRTYNSFLLVPLGTLFAVVASLSLWIQPLSGDLTRLGGFAENDFGWYEPQQQFPSLLFTFAKSHKYDRYYDVVVLGDSFSDRYPYFQWQNYLAQETGLSVVTYNADKTDVVSFVNSPGYTEHPPRIVIYETVERSLISRVSGWNQGDCQVNPTSSSRDPIQISPEKLKTRPYMRDARNGILHPNLSSGAHFLKIKLKRIFNKTSNKTIKLSLSRDDLFSNRQSNHLLVYWEDFAKFQVSQESLTDAICGLIYIQNIFQNNGTTFFIGVVAPDKLSAYSDFVNDDGRAAQLNWMKDIAKHGALNVPDLHSALKSEIAGGTMDVYRPNDTHWGSAGHRAVARALQKYLTENGVLLPQP
jgi:hypothetical protein